LIAFASLFFIYWKEAIKRSFKQIGLIPDTELVEQKHEVAQTKNKFPLSIQINERWLWVMFGISIFGFFTCFFLLINSVFGIIPGDVFEKAFIDRLFLQCMFSAPALSAGGIISYACLLFIRRKKR